MIKTYSIKELRRIAANNYYCCAGVEAFLDWLEAQEDKMTVEETTTT